MLIRLLLFLIAVGFSSPPSLAASASDQATQAKLQLKIFTYSLQAEDFGHALVAFGDQFKLPMGIEWAQSRQTFKAVNLSWRNATVEEMLDVLVKTQPDYNVEISDGIVHVFPASMHSSDVNFLNIKIPTFTLRNQVVEAASHRLRELVRPRVSGAESKSQHGGGFASSQATNTGDPEFSLSLENPTVRQVLDKFISVSDRRVWVVTFVSGENPAPSGYWRTTTLWTYASVPDSEQPVWDLLRWSDSVPSATPGARGRDGH